MYVTPDLVVDLWDLVKDYLPPNKKQALCDEWLKTFATHGVEFDVLAEVGEHESDFEKSSEEYAQDNQDEYDSDEEE